MKRYVFTPNHWMIFDYKGGTAIGYAHIQNSTPIISFSTDAGETGVMPYAQVENPRKLFIESREVNNIRKAARNLPEAYINFRKGRA